MYRIPSAKLLLKFWIMSVILGGLLVVFRGADRQNLAADFSITPPQARTSVPLTAKQLDAVSGTVPVYLNCQGTILILPDTLESIPCTIKNNSGKRIRALVLGESVTVVNNGTTATELGYVTIDNFVHPDFHTEGIAQSAEPQFPSPSAETYSGTITQVQVHIDFVEFNDSETLGPNKTGERILAGMRDGAAKYKSWLAKQYQVNGRSSPTLVRLIEDGTPTGADLGIDSASQEQGALIYQKWLRKTYQTKGVEEILKCLTNSSSKFTH